MIICSLQYYPTPFLVPLIAFLPIFLFSFSFLQIILEKWVFPIKILNEFFCNLLLNMFTFFPNTICYVVFYSLLNAYQFSKVCIFVFCFEKCQSKFQIKSQNNMLNTLWLIFLYF